jgi:hypothetical protein
MPTLYHIKPNNDGYHILGCSMTGNYFLINKDSSDIGWRGELIFKSEEETQKYIDTHNLTKDYMPEKFWRAEPTYQEPDAIKEAREMLAKANIKIKKPMCCPDCGHSLRCMCTVGADESHSHFSESLYHCENCLCDYNIVRDADGRFVKMTRHFWG